MNYLNLKRFWLPAILAGLVIGLLIVQVERVFSESRLTRHPGYADVIAPVLPFTVSILTNRQSTAHSNLLHSDPLLSKYLTPVPGQSSLGSGILISQDGLVVTNAHVINAADDIVVVSHEGLNAGVTGVWIDPETDVALLQTNLKINADLPINPERTLRVGDLVFTIGNPFGIGQSVSMGIVSATSRFQPGLTTLTDFIQTDAAINPGNSGGALVNIYGEVIGMNSAIFSANGNWQGIGFALPFNEVLKVAAELHREGQVSRGYLGIDVAELEANQGGGLRIIAVAANSPADSAGIVAGDLLLSINDMPLRSRTEAARLISSLMPEKQTSLTLKRGEDILELTVSLAKR